MAKEYGYVRVSTKDQNEDRQLIAMRDFGIENEYIFLDKQSGKDFNRPKYKQLLRRLKPYDTLVVKSINRLGRNYEDIIEQWRYITKEKQVSILVLDMPLLDTRRDKDLTNTLISDIVLQLLSYVAQTERENIHQRQAEGIAAAKARGIHMGRPALPLPKNYTDVAIRYMRNDISSREAGKELKVSATTFARWLKLNPVEIVDYK